MGVPTDALDPSDPAQLEARHNEIAAALEPVLVDGERWLVQLDRGHVHVSAAEHDTAGRSLLRFTHPDLYGRLLALNERLRSAGGFFGTELGLLLSLGGIALVETGLLEGHVEAETLAMLANGWVYAFYVVAVFVVLMLVRQRRARRHFRREVHTLLRSCDIEGIEHEQLVALCEGDQALERLLIHLKHDLAAKHTERRRYV